MIESIVSGVITPVMEQLVIPKIKSFTEKIQLDINVNLTPLEAHFKEYLERTYEHVSTINTIAFKNSQRKLKDIYIPLTIQHDDVEKKINYKVDSYPETLVDNYQKILITDTAGMGKSTLMKKIYLDIIEEVKGIPLFIELRRLSPKKNILQEIQEQLRTINKDFDTKLLQELLASGGFIIILDGYDEIKIDDRFGITEDIQNFINKTNKNKFFLTSRPDQSLASFGGFLEFKIQPLTKDEAYLLLNRYDTTSKVSTLLIEKLEKTEYSNMSEFLSNPLLTSLLFTAFEYKPTIPTKKHLFYRQVFDALFESHDLSKGDYVHEKHSKLDIDDFERVLRCLAYLCFFNNQKVEFSKDEIINLIERSCDYCVGLNIKASDFLKDITTVVPLFTIDGIYYKWVHKSLQEYFAARFIYIDSGEQKNTVLQLLYKNENLYNLINLLDLYYDIDYKSFRNVIIHELLKEYSKYSKNTYPKDLFSNISKEDIQIRKQYGFLYYPFIYIVDSQDKDEDREEKEEKMLVEYQFKLDLLTVQGIILNDNSNIICLYGSKRVYPLIDLLYVKHDPIVEFCEINPIKIPIHFCEKYKYKKYFIYEINDNSDNVMNKIENFRIVNDIMINSCPYKIRLNHLLALDSLKKIEKELSQKNNEDFFINIK